MDNATYDELSLTPINSDATYSRLRTTQTKIKTNDDHQRRTVSIDQSPTKGVKQTNTKETSNTKFNTIIIIMLVINTSIVYTGINCTLCNNLQSINFLSVQAGKSAR